jgi:hypothetical protein
MRARAAPVFLARKGYRARRLTDAARLLPVAGLILIFLPILWQPAATPEGDTAAGWVYLFAVWAGLIVAAFLLSRRLMPGPGDAQDQDVPTDGPDRDDDA